MSCGCGSTPYADYGYNGLCRQDLPYPQVSHESVPSLIDNLVTALYGGFYDPATGANSGGIIKHVVNGRVVWTTPCNPTTPPTIANVTPNPGEGMLCYLLRVFQEYNPADYINLNSVQTFTNKSLVAPTITGGASVSGTVDFSQATIVGGNYTSITVNSAANIAYGSTGQIPYQVAVGTTGFLTLGSAGSLLQSNGTLPTWVGSATAGTANTVALRDSLGGLTASSFIGPLTGNVSGNLFGNANTATTATTASSATLAGGLSGGVAMSIPYQSAPNTTALLPPSTAGYVLSTNGPGNPPSWIQNTATTSSTNNINGGAAGSVPYQSSGGTTAFVAAGTAGYVLQTNGAAAPTWLNPASLTAGTATNIAGGAAGSMVYQTGAGATASIPAGTSGQILKSNGTSAPSWVSAASANTASAIVQRDSNGSFSAGTVTAALFNGNATSANSATSAATATTANGVTGAVIAPENLTTGGPSWDANGITTIPSTIKVLRQTSSGEGGQVELARSVDNVTAYFLDVIGTGTSDNTFRIVDSPNSRERLVIAANGNVGIGTSSPNSKLEVIGNITSSGDFVGYKSSNFGTPLYLNNTGADGGHNWAITSCGSSNGSGAGSLEFFDGTANRVGLAITPAGTINTNSNPITNCPTTAKAWVNFNGATIANDYTSGNTVTYASTTDTVVTVTRSSHRVSVGDFITVSGVTGLTGSVTGASGVNGTFQVTATTTTTFTYGVAGTISGTVGGTAVVRVSTIRSSYNVSSITKNGQGDYTVNFGTPMADANYSAVFGAKFVTGVVGAIVCEPSVSTRTTSSLQIKSGNSTTAAATDLPLVSVTIFGN